MSRFENINFDDAPIVNLEAEASSVIKEKIRDLKKKTIRIYLPWRETSWKQPDVVGLCRKVLRSLELPEIVTSVSMMRSASTWLWAVDTVEMAQDIVFKTNGQFDFGNGVAKLTPVIGMDTFVKLHNLPAYVPLEEVELLVKRYGRVIDVGMKGATADSPSVVFVAKMRLSPAERDAVPDVLKVVLSSGERQVVSVSMSGRAPLCFRCGERGHTRRSCEASWCRACERYAYHEETSCEEGRSYAARARGGRPLAAPMPAYVDDDPEIEALAAKEVEAVVATVVGETVTEGAREIVADTEAELLASQPESVQQLAAVPSTGSGTADTASSTDSDVVRTAKAAKRGRRVTGSDDDVTMEAEPSKVGRSRSSGRTASSTDSDAEMSDDPITPAQRQQSNGAHADGGDDDDELTIDQEMTQLSCRSSSTSSESQLLIDEATSEPDFTTVTPKRGRQRRRVSTAKKPRVHSK